MRGALGVVVSVACADPSRTKPPGGDSGGPPAFTFPAPDAGPAPRGPGGPAESFAADALFRNCAALSGGEQDFLHHNLVVPYRGHLILPWSPEFGTGGISFFDMSRPCAPEKVGEGWSDRMRESHALGAVHIAEGPHAGDWLATTGTLGVQLWDISDVTAPAVVSYTELPDVFYPDAYARVVLSVFWQYPYLYAAGADNGIYILDATDPRAPVLLTQYRIDPALRAGGVFVMGTLMLVSSAEGSESVLLDVSDPAAPQPIPGGRFLQVDAAGDAWEAYHANLVGDWALFARKEGGSGVMVMDVSDPSRPTYAADVLDDGNGGYVFYDEGYAFIGESDIARIYDMRDLGAITLVGEGFLPGDLDTFTPYGNVAILSVDEDAEDGVASAVMPWAAEPDTAGPAVLRVVPADGAVGVAPTARIGLGFNEFVEPSSVFAGSIRLWDAEGNAVDGWGSAQETIASFAPKEPLVPGMTYTVEVPAGGVQDLNHNRTTATFTSTFTVAGGR